jgi:hypothetical protein
LVPIIASVGVGGTGPETESLYSETFPPTTGTDSPRHMSASPSTAAVNPPYTSGFSGLPPLRQSTAASGVAPFAARLVAFSIATARAPS